MTYIKQTLKRIIFTFLLWGFLIHSGYIAAQEVYSLTDYIQTALDGNYSIKVARNNEAVADNNYTIGNAGMLPVVTNTNRVGNSTGILSDDSLVTIQEQPIISSEVDLGMTIFRGFRILKTYRKLGVQKEISGLNSQMEVENLVARIVSEYTNYVQQLVLYDNLAYAVALSRERVRIDEERYLLGSASKLELLQSMVYLNEDSSRYARQNEVLRTVQIRLNALMASEDLGANIIPKDTIISIDKNLQYDDLLSLTLSENTSIRIATRNREISELDYGIIRSRAYPYLSLSSAYRLGIYESGLADRLDYGVTLGIDIFDGFNRQREKDNARIEIETSHIQYLQVEQEVKADLLTIFFAYENNLRLLRLEEQNLEVARENLEIALERYKLGSLSGLELREVQKSLLDAEERLILVKYLAKVAEISLMQISGRIMEYI